MTVVKLDHFSRWKFQKKSLSCHHPATDSTPSSLRFHLFPLLLDKIVLYDHLLIPQVQQNVPPVTVPLFQTSPSCHPPSKCDFFHLPSLPTSHRHSETQRICIPQLHRTPNPRQLNGNRVLTSTLDFATNKMLGWKKSEAKNLLPNRWCVYHGDFHPMGCQSVKDYPTKTHLPGTPSVLFF